MVSKYTSANNQDIEIDVDIMFAMISGKVTSAINHKVNIELKKNNIDLTAAQSSILLTLWRRSDAREYTQKQIADITYKDKPSITRLLDNMEKSGLVERVLDKEDRRTKRIALTEKAEKLKKAVRKSVDDAEKDAFKGLTEEEIQTVQKLMKKIFNNLEEGFAADGYTEEY